MSPDERRRQLLGIGLRMLVERPIQDLSIDAVASEAGISRGLLFHYFPTKTDYYDAVIGAALRRVRRNVAPDADCSPDDAIAQFVERFYAQIERRREFYVALVFGNGSLSLGGADVESHRMVITQALVDAADMPSASATVVHSWLAYVEDRALQWALDPREAPLEAEVAHCVRALDALLALG
ncbi:TetR family transcriptional regulator [Nocardioides baekrokdamisoli]|uniref:TetR family transcriptional regulator n=1 Tax=Nocardioides baekrokdamisoli TaxID=1804624 RepID=A0A3G9II22_9ACTN|nr:TetR family transcriptional regulator [Nocardioides baekrokdamisoli]